jgi:DNA mismatch endonuclease (patch repair protein)
MHKPERHSNPVPSEARPKLWEVDPVRSALMARVRQRDTQPELVVRSLIHKMGVRYRLHRRALPGSPDLVFPSRRKVIFVHGCFWHRHARCARCTTPKTRNEYWREKFEENMRRDANAISELTSLGWSVMIIWECETAKREGLVERIRVFLENTTSERSASSKNDAYSI